VIKPGGSPAPAARQVLIRKAGTGKGEIEMENNMENNYEVVKATCEVVQALLTRWGVFNAGHQELRVCGVHLWKVVNTYGVSVGWSSSSFYTDISSWEEKKPFSHVEGEVIEWAIAHIEKVAQFCASQDFLAKKEGCIKRMKAVHAALS
jgi:hypothetical protein